jgi:predicted nucleic acid-binding protein
VKIAVDTSVVVAALASWHDGHAAARKVVDGGAVLPAPAAVEAFSVLTCLGGDRRVPPQPVWDALSQTFPPPWPALDGAEYFHALERIVESHVAGGAAYDAIIAITAANIGAVLVSADRRAAPTYERLGVSFRLV